MNSIPSSGGGGKGYSSNTGPKGVLSDSRQADREGQVARAEAVRSSRAEQERRAITVPTVAEDVLPRTSATNQLPSNLPEDLELTPVRARSSDPQGAEEVPPSNLDLRSLDLSRLDLEALDLDPEELALLRQLRAEQLAGEAGPGDREEEDDELREWREARRRALTQGDVTEIDTEEFLELVEGHVGIVIYEEDAPRCHAVLDQAGVILRRHPSAAIVKITATALQFMTTDDGPDHAVLPAVLVYREGDLVSKHIRFEGDLETLLRTERLLPSTSAENRDDI